MLVSSIIGADVFDDKRSELQRLKTGRIGGVLDSLNDVADRHLAYGQLVFFNEEPALVRFPVCVESEMRESVFFSGED